LFTGHRTTTKCLQDEILCSFLGMETIKKKVRASKLTEFNYLGNAAEYALFLVNRYCKAEFRNSWSSVLAAHENVVSEEVFMKNYLWCVYVSGFSAQVVTTNFDRLLEAYGVVCGGHFVEAHATGSPDIEKVFQVWKNKAKFKAMSKTRALIKELSWPKFHEMYLTEKDPEVIGRLPFMGPALSRHLARNIGNMEMVKPDVHMVRLADIFVPHVKDSDAVTKTTYLCKEVRKVCTHMFDWPLGKVDMVLWYAMAITR